MYAQRALGKTVLLQWHVCSCKRFKQFDGLTKTLELNISQSKEKVIILSFPSSNDSSAFDEIWKNIPILTPMKETWFWHKKCLILILFEKGKKQKET